MELKVPESCQIACAIKLDNTQKEAFIRAINDNYRIHWILDNLPVGVYQGEDFIRGWKYTVYTKNI